MQQLPVSQLTISVEHFLTLQCKMIYSIKNRHFGYLQNFQLNICTKKQTIGKQALAGSVFFALLLLTVNCQSCPFFSVNHQPTLSSIIKSCRLTFFGHLTRTDQNADASQAIFKPLPENCRRPPGRQCTTWMKNIYDDLSSLDLGIHEARDLVQNQPLRRLTSLHSATHS